MMAIPSPQNLCQLDQNFPGRTLRVSVRMAKQSLGRGRIGVGRGLAGGLGGVS